MYYNKTTLFVMLCLSFSSFTYSQKIIPGEKMRVLQHSSVKVSDLPPGDTNYIAPGPKKRSPNEEKIIQKKKPTTEEELKKTVFPVQTIRTLKGNEEKITPISPQIFESPCVNYEGLSQLQGAGGGFIPPDVSGAVGFDHIMMALNDRFRIQNKDGTVLYEQLEQQVTGFWAGVGPTFLFDPKIIYDPYRQRWVFVILSDGGSSTQPQNSAILIATSLTNDPMGSWVTWRIDADADNNEWIDYPSVGFNRNWLVISGNMAQIGATGSANSRVFTFDINTLYSGGALDYSIFDIAGYTTVCPALTYDPTMNDLWCVTNDDVDDNDLRLFKISGTAGNPSLTEESFLTIGPDWGQGSIDIGPQFGTGTRINTGDHRVVSVVWRNGALYSAQTIFFPEAQNPANYSTIQLVVSDPVNASVYEAINFAANANSMYGYPCLAVNNLGDIIISCAKFTLTTYPSASVLVRRAGTFSFTETIFKAGDDWYVNIDGQGRNRWGDYTTAMVDPSDDNSVWVASEYSKPKAAGNVGVWGTRWAKICSGVCNTSTTVNTIQLSGTMKKYEASNVVFANSVIQPGAYIKLDAGNRVVLQPGFKATQGSKVRAFIEGCSGPQ